MTILPGLTPPPSLPLVASHTTFSHRARPPRCLGISIVITIIVIININIVIIIIIVITISVIVIVNIVIIIIIVPSSLGCPAGLAAFAAVPTFPTTAAFAQLSGPAEASLKVPQHKKVDLNEDFNGKHELGTRVRPTNKPPKK